MDLGSIEKFSEDPLPKTDRTGSTVDLLDVFPSRANTSQALPKDSTSYGYDPSTEQAANTASNLYKLHTHNGDIILSSSLTIGHTGFQNTDNSILTASHSLATHALSSEAEEGASVTNGTMDYFITNNSRTDATVLGIVNSSASILDNFQLYNDSSNTTSNDSLSTGLLSLNYSTPMMILVIVLLLTLAVCTVFGNCLVGLALFKFKPLRTVSNYLIGNLALSDFLLATTILPLSSVNEALGHWVFGEMMCYFWLCTDVLYCTASIWNLCIIAFDRFTATLYPVWYREKRSTKQAAIYIALVWTVSIGICIPALLGWDDIKNCYQYDIRKNVYTCNLFTNRHYVIYSASGSFYIPFVITTFLYIRIFMVLRHRMARMRNPNRNLHYHHNAVQQQKKPLIVQDNEPPPITTTSLQTNNLTVVTPVEIEMTTAATTAVTTNSGHTDSSKSLFGSDSPSNHSDEDSSDHGRSDNNPLYLSSDTEAKMGLMQNGVKNKKKLENHQQHNNSEQQTLVIYNPNHHNHTPLRVNANGRNVSSAPDSSETSDGEKVKIIVTADHHNNEAVKGNKSQAIITKQQQQHNNNKENGKKSAKKYSEHKNKNSEHSSSSHISQFKLLNLIKSPRLRTKQNQRPPRQRHRQDREVKATIRMAIIIAFFCGFWIGFFTIYLLRGIQGENFNVPPTVDSFFFWLGYSNSVINPILYTIFNEDFRKAFQKILGCYNRRNRQPGYSRTRH